MKKSTYRPAVLKTASVSTDEFLSGALDREIRTRIKAVVDTEAPVSERLLIKRVINSFGIQKAGVNVRDVMMTNISALKLKTTADKDIVTYWKNGQTPEMWNVFRVPASEEEKRDVLDVAKEEIAAAAASLIRGKKDVPYGDLARETAQLLGYTRMGNNVVDMIKKGIDTAVKRGYLKKKGSLYSEGKI